MYRKTKRRCLKSVFFVVFVICSVIMTLIVFDKTYVFHEMEQGGLIKYVMLKYLKLDLSDRQVSMQSILRSAKIHYSSLDTPLNFIPEPWEIPDPNRAPYINPKTIGQYLELPETEYKQTVAILTIVRNSESVLGVYGNELMKLSYPHKLISVFIGESESTDDTVYSAGLLLRSLKTLHGFKDTDIYVMNISGGIYGSANVRHLFSFQLTRRSHMALARNTLLKAALKKGNFDYFLWIDSDIEELPADLVQQMLYAEADVVTTPCYIRERNYKEKYDKNSWQETKESLNLQSNLADNELVVEGYNRTGRLYLPQLLSLGRIVPLDGVGGCTLMVRGDCFRNGLIFPEKVYKHHIETEGLAKMAHAMNYSVVGLPFVDVYHGHSTAG